MVAFMMSKFGCAKIGINVGLERNSLTFAGR